MDDIFTSSSSLLPRTITVAHDREYFSCEDAKLQFGNWVDKVISKLYNGKFGKNLLVNNARFMEILRAPVPNPNTRKYVLHLPPDDISSI